MLNNKYLIINILFNASALRLQICIFRLKIEIPSDVLNFSLGIRRFSPRLSPYLALYRMHAILSVQERILPFGGKLGSIADGSLPVNLYICKKLGFNETETYPYRQL